MTTIDAFATKTLYFIFINSGRTSMCDGYFCYENNIEFLQTYITEYLDIYLDFCDTTFKENWLKDASNVYNTQTHGIVVDSCVDEHESSMTITQLVDESESMYNNHFNKVIVIPIDEFNMYVPKDDNIIKIQDYNDIHDELINKKYVKYRFYYDAFYD